MAEIIAFYSYKGGVGRSLTLANVAALIANRGKRVVCIDYDLEAGGLHTIFKIPTDRIENTILDLLGSIVRPPLLSAVVDISDKLNSNGQDGRLWVVPAISESDKVLRALEPSRDQVMLLGSVIQSLVDAFNPHYIFVDSRSGFAELASAALLKADRLVCVLRPNNQNAEGLRLLFDILDGYRDGVYNPFLVLSQIPDLPQTAARIEKLEGLIGARRSFGAQIPFAPELALEESVVALSSPCSALARCYFPIVEWLEGGNG